MPDDPAAHHPQPDTPHGRPPAARQSSTSERRVLASSESAAAAGPTPRKSFKPWIIALGCVIAAAAVYLLAGWLSGTHIGSGTRIGGVDVSGKSIEDARETLADAADKPDQSAVKLSSAEGGGRKATSARTSTRELGMKLNVNASVDRAAGFTLNPATIADRIFGSHDYLAVFTVDSARFDSHAGKLATRLSTGARPAGIAVNGRRAEVRPARTGLEVRSADIRHALGRWPGKHALRVSGTEHTPAVSTEEAHKVRDAVAQPALQRPLTVRAQKETGKGKNSSAAHGTGGVDAAAGQPHDLRLSPTALGSALSFKPDGSTLKPRIDGKRLRTALEQQNRSTLTPGKDAGFTIKDRKPVVVPARTGISVDEGQLGTRVTQAVVKGKDSAKVALKVRQPKLTTAAAKKLEMKRIAKFSTPYSSESARDNNLRVATGRVSGTVVMPGKQFSLNKTIKERTAANGYQRAGVISGGEMKEDYGGGVSQVSTTLFNAAFFSGQQLDQHKAHSRWISRYPEGRESTLDWNSIDMAFTNTAKTPIVLDMYLKDGKVHAQVFGTKTVEVKAKSSDRFNHTSPQTVTRPAGAGCAPQSPRGGWSITIHRTIKHLDSGKVTRDKFTTTYNPVDEIRCEAKK